MPEELQTAQAQAVESEPELPDEAGSEQEDDEDRPSVPDFLKERPGLSDHARDLLSAAREFHLYAISRGSNRSTFGWNLFAEYVEGIEPGLYLVAGAPNHGKTAFISQMAWQIAHQNDDYLVLFMTLDDNINQVIPRFCAMETGAPMNLFSRPLRYANDADMQEAYMRGLRALADSIDRFRLLDGRFGSDVELLVKILEEQVESIKRAGQKKKLALFIDNFHDLKTADKYLMRSENSRYEYVSEGLKELSRLHEMPIVCTAEIRKVGGRRPTLEDIRETGNIAYEANLVLGVYNEVGVKKEAARVYYRTQENGPKMPVLEVDFLKNKLSGYKGRLFYMFFPDRSRLAEADQELTTYYEQQVNT